MDQMKDVDLVGGKNASLGEMYSNMEKLSVQMDSLLLQ
tara:strand:- start:4416 stop:4529 length:114 start_codon:yes stop_codon:yes gene_type:complete